MKTLSFEWIVFLKVLENKPLQNWDEFTVYERIFKKPYNYNQNK